MRTLEEIVRATVINRLRKLQGNRTYAAISLGVSIRTIRNMIVKYQDQGFDVPAPTHSRCRRFPEKK